MHNKIPNCLFFFLFIHLIFTSCTENHNYNEEIKIFKEKRINYLKSRKGYLNLVGLHWIFNGNYTIGSSQENDIPFPKVFPANLGKMTITNDSIKFTFKMPILLDSLKKITSYNYAKKNLNHNFSWKSFQWYIIER